MSNMIIPTLLTLSHLECWLHSTLAVGHDEPDEVHVALVVVLAVEAVVGIVAVVVVVAAVEIAAVVVVDIAVAVARAPADIALAVAIFQQKIFDYSNRL